MLVPAGLPVAGPPQPWASEADMEAVEAGRLQETRKQGHLHPRGLVGSSSCHPSPRAPLASHPGEAAATCLIPHSFKNTLSASAEKGDVEASGIFKTRFKRKN